MNHFALRYMCLLRKYGEAPQSNTTTCFIIDDTVLEKSGVRLEGVSRVFDHVKGRCVLGYKLLLCAFFDGKTTIPFDFSLHQEKGKQGNCGLTKQQRKKAYHTKKNNGSPDFNLVFLGHSEAYFSPFGLSESLRSPFFLHLAFLSHSEAHFFSIWPF